MRHGVIASKGQEAKGCSDELRGWARKGLEGKSNGKRSQRGCEQESGKKRVGENEDLKRGVANWKEKAILTSRGKIE